MVKRLILVLVGVSLFCCSVWAQGGEILRFVYCSDLHYGLERLYRNVTIEAADDRFQKQPTEVEEPLFIDDYDDSDIADNAATDDKKA